MDIAADDLSLSLLHFAHEKYQESNDLLLHLDTKDYDKSFIEFCIGRNYFYSSNMGQARVWFERSRNTTPAFRWTYYELAKLLEASGEISAACHQMAAFIRIVIDQSKVSEISQAHIGEIIRIAHKAFDHEHENSADLYDLICTLEVRDYLSELRLVESKLNRGRLYEAAISMKRLTDLHILDSWGHLVSARIQFARDNHQLGLEILTATVNSNSSEISVKITATHILLTFGLTEAADDIYKTLLKEMKHENIKYQSEIDGVEFRLNVSRAKYEQLLKDCHTSGFLERIPNWICVDSLFNLNRSETLSTQSRALVTLEVERLLAAQTPKRLGTILSLFQSYRHRRLWDKIEHLKAEIEADQVFEHHDVILSRFECLCSALKIVEAEAFYYKYYAKRQLRQWETCAVLRFLVEAKMWTQTKALFLDFFSNGYILPSGNHFLLKICRRFCLHANIIEIIDAFPLSDRPSQYNSLRILFYDDLLIRKKSEILNVGSPDQQRELSPSNAFFSKSLELGDYGPSSCAGYLCVDKAFFFAALTFLSSFATHTLCVANMHWFVFLSADIPECWTDILLNFSEKINLRVRVIKEIEVREVGIPHVEEYGIFTGGNSLSPAAFLRIYAANFIYKLGHFDRAIYFDSDIVCIQDISALVSHPFEGKLLLARLEETSPEIQLAIDQHDLAPLSYFNSGVLAFNLSNFDIQTCILNAIYISQHKASLLIFHDQCALNLAFANQTKFLEPKFNFFVRSSRIDNGDLSPAVLLHFLDQPKPWDLAYASSYRAIWLRYAGMVRVLLSNADYRRVVQAANWIPCS